MSLTLFSKEECPFCLQVKVALQYFDVDYELKEWKTPDKTMLLKYSPQGTSPVLLVDDFPIWDSISIIYYLEDSFGNSKKTLFPGNEKERAKARLLHTYNNSIAGKSLREVIFEKRGKEEADWDWDRIKQGDAGWRETLDWLEENIEAEDSFLAAGFSIADAALLPRFYLAEKYDVAVDKRHPKLSAWLNNYKSKKLMLYK